MKYILSVLCTFAVYSLSGQNLTGEQLLGKSIQYHDPQENWSTFQGDFKVVLETPNGSYRESMITINLPQEYFNVSTLDDGKTSFREIQNGNCRFTAADETVKEASVDGEECARTVMFKNYYTYLYGLPMKLRDPGTHIDPVVSTKTFKGKEYLVLRVTYDQAVGSDIWQFYFDPSTYAMEIYQFFKGSNEKTGEYILLTEEATVNGIKMPKNRAWYYNKDDGYLGTDKIMQK